jgi:hypothetical protein
MTATFDEVEEQEEDISGLDAYEERRKPTRRWCTDNRCRILECAGWTNGDMREDCMNCERYERERKE